MLQTQGRFLGSPANFARKSRRYPVLPAGNPVLGAVGRAVIHGGHESPASRTERAEAPQRPLAGPVSGLRERGVAY